MNSPCEIFVSFYLCFVVAGIGPRISLTYERGCRIVDALSANDGIWLLVRPEMGNWDDGTVAVFRNGELRPPNNAIGPWHSFGLAKTLDAEVLIAKLAPGREVVQFLPSSLSDDRVRQRLLELLEREQFLCTFPSQRNMYLTTHRIGNVADRSSERLLGHPIYSGRVRADLSGNFALIATMGVDPVDSGIFFIDLRNGATMSVDYGLDPGDVSSVLADPELEGAFYIGTGKPTTQGQLLHVFPPGEPRVAFKRKSPRLRGIRGVPDAGQEIHGERDEPVLAISTDGQGKVHFVTTYGVYRIADDGEINLVGSPVFRNVGGFFLASNVEHFVVMLTRHVDSNPGFPCYSARYTDVLLITTDK